jgi:hypothetical protein
MGLIFLLPEELASCASGSKSSKKMKSEGSVLLPWKSKVKKLYSQLLLHFECWVYLRHAFSFKVNSKS